MLNIREFLGLAYYTSELDQFLNEYNKAHPQLSDSQRREIEKYAHIYALRDNPSSAKAEKKQWDQF